MVNRRTVLAVGAAAVVGQVFTVERPAAAAVSDEKPIQAALHSAHKAGGGQVVVGAGRWNIVNAPLRIYANTRLTFSPGTLLVRTGQLTAMLCNGPRDGSDTTTSGYGGQGNIIVEGGVWDANARGVSKAAWAIVFAHARDITVRDLEIRDVPEWHAVELNSTYNGTVSGCRFIGATPRPSGVWNEEAVSIDLAAPGLQPFGAGDNTQSQLIRIVDNYCEDWPTFAGCHTGGKDGQHEQFVISGNTARNLEFWGISVRNASRVVISDNTLSNVGGGIWVRPHFIAPAEGRPVTSVVVSGNVVDGVRSSDGIRLIGEASDQADGRIYGAVVTGNTVRGAGLNGIALQHAPAAMVSGNTVRGATRSGIAVTGGQHQQIGPNLVVDAAQSTEQPYDAIRLNGVRAANVQGNKVVSTGTRRPASAIASDAASSGLFCTNNDVRDGYAVSAFDLQGSGHRTDPGNAA